MDNSLKHQSNAASAKVERPHEHFQHPAEVVVDPSLSKQEKSKALETMEQDARELAVASAEGMTGGEDSRLHDVLTAKEALELPAAEVAFSVVLATLKSHLSTASKDDRTTFTLAIEALEAAWTTLRTESNDNARRA